MSSSDPTENSGLAERTAWALDRLTGGARRVGLAVSGGSDSTALLHLAADWARTRDVQLACATVDHGLRAEAEAEARGVGAACARLGVEHAILAWRPQGKVSQADARMARHRLLASWARESGLAHVALAHTSDDRIETFLIRARAGSGWYGLAGPMPSAPSPAGLPDSPIRIIRPLLWADREALRADLRARGEPWVEDPSNLAWRHERVRMRALATRLAQEARTSILRTMDRLAELRAATDLAGHEFLATAQPAAPAGRQALGFDAALYASLPAVSRTRLIEALVMAATGCGLPPRRASVQRLDDDIATGRLPGSTLGGLLFRLSRGRLDVRLSPPRRGETARSLGDIAAVARRAQDLLSCSAADALSPPGMAAPRAAARASGETDAHVGGR